jgi:hypothetical protein
MMAAHTERHGTRRLLLVALAGAVSLSLMSIRFATAGRRGDEASCHVLRDMRTAQRLFVCMPSPIDDHMTPTSRSFEGHATRRTCVK